MSAGGQLDSCYLSKLLSVSDYVVPYSLEAECRSSEASTRWCVHVSVASEFACPYSVWAAPSAGCQLLLKAAPGRAARVGRRRNPRLWSYTPLAAGAAHRAVAGTVAATPDHCTTSTPGGRTRRATSS